MLAQSAVVTLQAWQVFAGGQGYDAVTVATGTTGATLLAYLQPSVM